MTKSKTNQNTYRLQLTISRKLLKLIKEKAAVLGVKPQEYMRHLIIEDLCSDKQLSDKL